MKQLPAKNLYLAFGFAFLCFQTNLLAQNTDITSGYYISSQGDSLSGQIHIGDIRHNVLKFRVSKNDPWTFLSPQLIKEASGENNVHILPQEIRTSEEPEYIFIQKVVEGGYSLYKGYTVKGSTLFFALMKEGKTMVKINPFGYESQLKALLDSCGQHITTRSLRYNTASLSRCFAQANQCAYPDKKTSSIKNKFKSQFGMGLSTFYYNINPVVGRNNYFSGDYHNINRFSGGISARLRIRPALSVFVGLNYIDKRIRGDSVVAGLGYTKDVPGSPPIKTGNYYRFASDLNFKYLEVPIGVTHHFLPYAKLSPSFSCGFALQVPFVYKIESDWGYPICLSEFPCTLPPGEIGHISPTGVNFRKELLINFFAGAGLRKTLKNKNEWEARVDYFIQSERTEVGTNKIEPQGLELFMKTSRLQISLNYYFYFKNRSK